MLYKQGNFKKKDCTSIRLHKRELETYSGRFAILVTDNVAKDLCPTERLWHPKLKQNVMKRCSCESYRNAAEGINDLLERSGTEKFSHRTLQDVLQREGHLIEEKIEDLANQTLSDNGFDCKTGDIINLEKFPNEISEYNMSQSTEEMMKVKIKDAVDDHNSENENKYAFVEWDFNTDKMPSPPDETVTVAVDGVGVDHQKEKRNDEVEDKEKFIQTYVAYVRSKEGIFRIATGSLVQTLLIVLAYLLQMKLLVCRNLEFFIDGENKIKDEIKRIFSFRKFDLYLDWYHLRLKCYQKLSEALFGGKKNKERNKKIRDKLYSFLFAGKTDLAIQYIDNIDKTIIKNMRKLDEIKCYINRKSEYIYKYVIRQRLGLINSSNQCEKSNELLIANRCKNKGMSWTYSGLNGMRNIQIVRFNNESEWYSKRQLLSRPVPLSERLRTLHEQYAPGAQANKPSLCA